MPYILQHRRDALDAVPLAEVAPIGPGELNYCLTRLTLNFMNRQGLSYQALNNAVGALEAAKLEIWRRLGGPYEDTKIQENGDVT